VGVSSGHLSREFHKQFRTGIAGALEIVRLASAAITLQRTNLNLAEVADATGFADAYHFSHRFSSAYGEPPGRFRRRLDADPLEPLERAGLGPVWSATLGAG
jgi:AraC family transcriptional regulator